MLRIPKGRYHLVSLQCKKLLIYDSVEYDSPDEAGASNAPKEPEPMMEMEVIKDTKKPEPRKPRFGLVMDPYIKFYDLESGVLDFAKVGRSYGIPDMYKDVDHERVYHVRELLSKLESDVAIIYHRIKKVHESEESNFSITRRERNILRKFLFTMKYRSQKFWSKYTGTIDAYEHSDPHRIPEGKVHHRPTPSLAPKFGGNYQDGD